MAKKYQSIPLKLPAEFVEASSGFSLDIGCSTAKLIYRSKEDYENGKPIVDELKTGMGRAYLIPSIARTELDDVIALIRDKCDLIHSGSEPTEVFTTGAGCNLFKERLEKGLNIKLNNLMEFECFFQSFHHLSQTTPISELFYPPNEKGEELGRKEAEQMKLIMDKFFGTSAPHDDVPAKEAAEEDGVFPCIVAMCGSGLGFMQIEADGKTWKILDGTSFGGRAFLGLSALLTGDKDFATILANIETGTGHTANDYMSDIIRTDLEGETYSEMVSDTRLERPSMYFGKAVTQERDTIKNEDILRSLFELLCQHVIQLGLYQCLITKVYRIYFCGNLFNNEYSRFYMAQESINKQALLRPEKEVKLRFIRHGGHLGSLGAFMKAKSMKENSE